MVKKPEKLIGVIDRIIEVRDKSYHDTNILLNEYGWDQSIDIRITSLIKLVRVLIALHLALHSLIEMSDDDYEHWPKLKLPKAYKIDIESYLVSYKTFLEISFVNSLFSVVESSIRVYSKQIDSEYYSKNQGKFYKLSKYLLVEQLDRKYVYGFQWLNLIRNIRNTIHNNGVFSPVNGKELVLDYKEKSYRFIPGKIVDFVSWYLLLDLADDLRNLLFQLSNNEKIKTAEEPIIDPSRI